MNIKDTMKLGLERTRNGYKKNKPLVLIIVAGGMSLLSLAEMYKEGPKIKEGLKETVEDFKKAKTTKEKAVVIVEGTTKVGLSVAKVAGPEALALYCMGESYNESNRRIWAFAGMAAASQLEKFDYREVTKEVVGKKKANEIDEKVAERQFKRDEGVDELTEFNDADVDNPDIINDKLAGCTWRDKYINVLNSISSYYTHAKTGSALFYPVSELYDYLDQNKDGNYIRRGEICSGIGIMQSDLKNIDNAQDMIKIVQAGPNRYKLVWQVPIKPDPDGKYYDSSFDSICGDGDWNGSLNPEERA